jgi:2-oxoisovalerate dehydrogenase E1 component alpha subunit
VSIIASFEIQFTRFVDPAGQSCADLPAFAEDPCIPVMLYRVMQLARTFDAKAIALQRTGRLGTYASSLGQEAVATAVGTGMQAEDVLLPSYRDAAAQLQRGVSMVELLLYWGGDERGMNFAKAREDFPICVPIATQTTQAAGVAAAFKLRRQARVAVCLCGDGATSKGDFYEAMNLAGVWNLPVVFVINNNQWAISTPRALQTAAATLAQKAIAAGFAGEQVDGNDAIAVYAVFRRALERARSGGGPTLVEALTYRLCDHTTADDASRYRDAAELRRHQALEPITRLRAFLTARGAWSQVQEEALLAACAAEVEAAAEAFLAMPPQPPESMFDHLYANLPTALKPQRDAVARGGRHG